MKKQNGMTLIGMLLTAAAIILFSITVMRIIPVYIQHYAVSRSIGAIKKIPESDFSAEPAANAIILKKKLMNQLYVNGVEIPEKQVTIKPTAPGKFLITIKYEVIKPIIGNMSLLFQFDEATEVKTGAE